MDGRSRNFCHHVREIRHSNRLNQWCITDRFSVCKLAPGAPIPSWATSGSFWAITRTSDELSIVCADENVPVDVQCERDWRMLQVAGPLDFALTGILAAIATPLAEAGVSIFALSTFDTDYILVREQAVDPAIKALTQAGHWIIRQDQE